ncbi:MAG TPA: PKD domain-containing protein [Puia sp.]|nr:PKD domain-containing protein [Puia sp.]
MHLQPAKTYLRKSSLLLAMLLSGIIASAQLTARFTMDKTGGCSPVIVNFKNQTYGASPNATYTWDFGNGNTSTLTDGGAVYTDEKTYTVTLTVQDGSNQSTYQQQVTVYSPPTVDFSVSPAKTCLGMPVNFTPNATPGSGNISYYTWDFGDGSTVQQYTAGTQPHYYTAEVTAPVSLTVTNTYGCHTTLHKNNMVTIIPALTSSFTADKRVLCQVSDPIQFTNSSTGPGTLDYKWDFGDGTGSTDLNPTHTFNKKGFYTVSLTVHSSEGCTLTSTQSNPINVASYSTDFSVPTPICIGSYVTFTPNSSPAPDNSQWVVDGAPYYSYGNLYTYFSTLGDHTIELRNTFGTCPQSAVKHISVKDVPHPTGFTSSITSPCGSPVAVNFNDPTPGAVRSEWDFNYLYYNNPNITSTKQNPSYTYTADGSYSVWLRSTNADGCSATTIQTVNITRPAVNIYADPAVLSVCSSLMTITFHTSSSEALTSTSWNFGDGGTSTDPNPTHGFKNTGTYNVTLSYKTASGCTGTFSYKVNSQPPPNPVAVYTTPGNPAVCNQPITVTFTTYSSEPLTTTNWTFGDGNATSTGATPSHTYPNTGKYIARLDYVTQSGCKGTVYSNVITVDPLITALDLNINPNPVCGNTPAIFSTNPTTAMDINSYTWDFGDGTVNYGSSPSMSHTYGAEGTYTAKVYVRSVGGCDTTITKTVIVKPPFPHLDSYTNTCDGTRGDVTFSQSSVNATSLVWNFGDGSTLTTPGNQAQTTHTYKKTGFYTPTLTAINGTCSLTTSLPYGAIPVLLKQNPLLTGDKSSACGNTTVNIQIANFDRNPFQSDNVYDYGSYYTGYIFTDAQYGDGTPFTGVRSDPYYNYRWITSYTGTVTGFKAGEQGLRFIFKSLGFGCMDTTNIMPLAIKGAVGGFQVDADKLCYQSPVVLEDTSHSTPDNKILSWTWNFGDGNTLTQNKGGKITHLYANPGAYYVSMQITDAAGCSSNIPSTQSVSVNGPKAAFYPSGTDVHLNTTVYFYNNTQDYGNTNTTYSWDFGDGATSTDPYPSHTYTVPGTYTVTMSASNPSVPCASTATPVTIIVRNFNSHFQYNSSYVTGSCPPLLVSFTNTSYNAVSVAWDFGDGNTAGNVNYPSHVYEKAGTYIVTLTVYTYNGLQGQYIDSVIIRQPSVVLPKAPPETCIGNNVTLSSNVTYGSNYTWDFGDGSIVASPDGNATHKYLTAGSYIATLLVQNDAGCVTDTTLPDPVKIRPNPVATVSPASPVICRGDSQPLTASGGSVYQWSPATGLSDPDIATPIASPTVTTDYTLTIKDDIGCQNTAPLTVQVVQPGNLQLRPTASICAGDTLQLNASGETLYTWIDDTQGLDHTDIANPVGTPTEDITYTVEGSDDHRCFVHTKSIVVAVHPLPTVNAGPNVMVEAGYDATLNATGSSDIIRWQWLPQKYLSCYDCPSPVCLPLATTEYVLKVYNQYCKASDTIVVAVDCQESHVRIPNAFTPNNDGSNDVFMIKGISIVKHMVIFGRWGEKVFERNDFIAGDRASCWDGTYNGQKCAPGTYVYFVEMECPSGGTFSRKGSFILIR